MPSPVTDELFQRAFGSSALITAKAAAALLGLDEKTLSALVLRGSIGAVSVGKQKRFTEADLRAFLETTPPPTIGRHAPARYPPIEGVKPRKGPRR